MMSMATADSFAEMSLFPLPEVGGWSMAAPAKVNLFLEVLRRRADGFHDLFSLFQTIPLCDTLSVTLADTLTLACETPGIPQDASNLILKAASALQRESNCRDGAAFALVKRIPDGGGLGGGSSDAAAALLLCNKLWGLGLSIGELAQIGAGVGSDVPFFLYGGVCQCEGRGEVITPRPDLQPLPVGVAAPDWKISTPQAFRSLRPEEFGGRSATEFLHAWEEYSRLRAAGAIGDDTPFAGRSDDTVAFLLRRLYDLSFNHFEDVAFRLEPRQGVLHEALRENGWLPRLSGSGSCCWLLPACAGFKTPPDQAGLRIFTF